MTPPHFDWSTLGTERFGIQNYSITQTRNHHAMHSLTHRYGLAQYVLLLRFYLRPNHQPNSVKTTLHSSTRDKEPLVDTRINRSRELIVSLGDGRNLAWVDMAGRLGNSQIGTTKC